MFIDGHQNYCDIFVAIIKTLKETERERREYLGRQHTWVARKGLLGLLKRYAYYFKIHDYVV